MARWHGRIGRGLLAGMAGGLIASWTMNQFQTLWSKTSEQLRNTAEQQPQGESQEQSEDATMKTADKLSRNFLRRSLTNDEKKKAGPMVHYAFGTVMGGLYGVAAELAPEVAKMGFGTAFGAVLFTVADEIAVPVSGLSGKPTESPLSAHLYGLASHLVYGATTEGIRRVLAAL